MVGSIINHESSLDQSVVAGAYATWPYPYNISRYYRDLSYADMSGDSPSTLSFVSMWNWEGLWGGCGFFGNAAASSDTVTLNWHI